MKTLEISDIPEPIEISAGIPHALELALEELCDTLETEADGARLKSVAALVCYTFLRGRVARATHAEDHREPVGVRTRLGVSAAAAKRVAKERTEALRLDFFSGLLTPKHINMLGERSSRRYKRKHAGDDD